MKYFVPLTPSQRHLCLINRSFLWKGKPLKILSYGMFQHAGRNNQGRRVIASRGGGHKRNYRLVDIKRNLTGVPALVLSIEYDPNRSSFIALILYKNGIFSYILAPHMLQVGDSVFSGSVFKVHTLYNVGFAAKLLDIPIGSVVHNIELLPSKGGELVRSAGTYAVLLKKDTAGYCVLRLPSGERRLISQSCVATIGSVSNPDHLNQNLGKAGRNRWLGRRPHVRGTAMNPIDHPHGGATSGGKIPVTPWKRVTKGCVTRKTLNRWVFVE